MDIWVAAANGDVTTHRKTSEIGAVSAHAQHKFGQTFINVRRLPK